MLPAPALPLQTIPGRAAAPTKDDRETEARGLPKWVTVLQRADLEWENGCSAAAHLCWKSRLVLVARGVSPHLGHGEVVWGHGHPWVIPGWVPRAVQLQMLHVPSMAWGQPGGQ